MKVVVASSKNLSATFRARVHHLAALLGVSMEDAEAAAEVVRLKELQDREDHWMRKLTYAQTRVDNIRAEMVNIRMRLNRHAGG